LFEEYKQLNRENQKDDNKLSLFLADQNGVRRQSNPSGEEAFEEAGWPKFGRVYTTVQDSLELSGLCIHHTGFEHL
jgi:hypothetical protein